MKFLNHDPALIKVL